MSCRILAQVDNEIVEVATGLVEPSGPNTGCYGKKCPEGFCVVKPAVIHGGYESLQVPFPNDNIGVLGRALNRRVIWWSKLVRLWDVSNLF